MSTQTMPVTDHIRNKLSQLPHKPGIYLMKDRFGTVIYVGKARDLRKRVSQYFHPSRRMGWDLKLNALVDAIHDFDVHVVKNEPESLLLEGRLIKEFHPRYNVSFRDDKRFLLLKVNMNDPIPRFTLTRLKTDDGARYFGPFAHSGALRSTLTMIRRKFNLRGCRPLTPGEADYKHCLYGNLKFCTAPCINNVSREQYILQVLAACEFLEGQSDEMERQLESEMKKAAGALDFEKAAQLRDALDDLRRTTKKTGKFQRLPYTLPVAIQPDKDLADLARALNLAGPPERIEGYDISNISGTYAVASMVAFKNGKPDRSNYRRFKMKTVVGQNDFACMAETIKRRYSRFVEGEKAAAEFADAATLEQSAEEVASGPAVTAGPTSPKVDESFSKLPNLILIDGGKGQLNAACEELAKLNLATIPIIGLAKEFEEIYVPGQSEPIRLDHNTGALKLLQRVRDESHRFANTYNAQLRLKRISESILDEFPGIGQRRKAALLKRFGSVQRLRLATLEQIAEVPGFGGKAAQELKAFLEARSNISRPAETAKNRVENPEVSVTDNEQGNASVAPF
ncbi:MAG TPA: excinuclease ABC subunit UvrC [Verrucomicrobiae bacterium]|nr:excinuclease ABC subunit UvrC [Verrucomicrobiae bacterium]